MSFSNVAVFIQAGGLGTRLRKLYPDLPKPLVPIGGKPLIFWQIDQLLVQGFEEIHVLAGYRGDMLSQYLNREYGPKVKVVIEQTALGSGGCLSLGKSVAREFNLVVSGDLLFDFDFARLVSFHQAKKAFITMTIHSNTHPLDADLVDFDRLSGQIYGLFLRPHPAMFRFENRVNAALSVLNRDAILALPDQLSANFELDIVKPALQAKRPIYGYYSLEYIKDVGTPERWNDAERELKASIPHKRAISSPRRAVFIGRGVLRECRDVIGVADYLNELPLTVIEAIKVLNGTSLFLVVIDDLEAAPRQNYNKENRSEWTIQIETLLGRQDAKIDCSYSPVPNSNDHLDAGKSSLPEMLLAAKREHYLDLTTSYLISASESDLDSSISLQIRTILLTDRTTEGLTHLAASTLKEAVSLIVE